MFKPVSREQNRLRMAIDGPAGSGKTYTALVMAFALAEAEGLKVAVIDTEHKSASLYAGENGWDWDGVELDSFAPSTYSACIKNAAIEGFGVLVIDSLSHAWAGVGGALDQVDKSARKSGGKFGAWRDVTPQHNEMIEWIRKFPGHVIATLRSKMEYALTEDEKGKTRVEKLGMKPVQREGVEYEFDIVADMDIDHRMTVSKTRFSGIDGQISSKPGPEWMGPVIHWLKQGTPRKEEDVKVEHKGEEKTLEAIAIEIKVRWKDLGWSAEKLRTFLFSKNCKKVTDLPRETGLKLVERLRLRMMQGEAKDAF